MIITLVKKQTGLEFISEMEDIYKSINELEKLFKRTNNMKMYVDLENWRYYKENPDETIETTESLVTNKLSLSDLDLIILNTIKHEKPRSIRDLANKINKDVSNIQPKVKKLEKEGFIKFEDGIKNSKIPYLTFDEIKLEI
ncbi:MAG: MarR family transcriptional regulator [Methanobrevibacter thaueri]|jgi:DNA-binding MarR family transcriptional regulator|uniref:HVO_A0114 family putative DNA-binding protein n=1 Tax=Methanobrevibacter thaueri TaxID=190975 RepID=UPI0026E9BECD|nr:MarR family transcriptional regulator [Methanobrevibacter thaueri]MBE6495786.1 MarR family transcriptional regulator [Methanobrevibacter thaueri]